MESSHFFAVIEMARDNVEMALDTCFRTKFTVIFFLMVSADKLIFVDWYNIMFFFFGVQ